MSARAAGARRQTECLHHPALWLFSKHAARPYTDAAFQPGDALVFGSESRGLPPSLFAETPRPLPPHPHAPEARSLNLAVTVAVAAYEALRQFGGKGVYR